MKVSNELKFRLDELKKIGSAHLNFPLKKELATIWKEKSNETLNVDCATCVLRVMHKVNKMLIDGVQVKELVQEVKMVKLSFEQLNEMKLPELRKIDKGVKAKEKSKWIEIYLKK